MDDFFDDYDDLDDIFDDGDGDYMDEDYQVDEFEGHAANHDDCPEFMDMKNFIIGIGFLLEMTRGDRKPRT